MTSFPPGVLNVRGAGDLRDVLVGAQGDGGLAGRLAEVAGVLPDVDGLRAEGDAVEGGLVAVLAGDRDLAGEALGLERRDDAAGHAVVLGEHGVDLVVGARSGSAPCSSGRSSGFQLSV